MRNKEVSSGILGRGLIERILVVTLLSLINIVTLGSILNIILAIPQIIYVLYILFVKRDLKMAIVMHMIFTMTCVSPLNAKGFSEAGSALVIYSYAKLKLIGPIGISYLIWILIFINSIFISEKSAEFRNSLFYKLFKYLLILDIIGNFLGLFGFAILSGYSLDGFISYNVYIQITIIVMYCLVKNNSHELMKLFYDLVIPLFVGSILATMLSFLLWDVTTTYGAYEDIILQPDILYFGVLLLLSLFWTRYKGLVLLAFLFYVIINISSPSGKSLLFVFIGLVFFVYLLYFAKTPALSNSQFVRRARIIFIIIAVIPVIILLPKITLEGNLLALKMQDVTSLFSGDLSEIDRSPFIRIATILNIIDNNLSNPIGLILGQGYGGYFTDSLNFFVGLNLEHGAWGEEIVRSGRFSSAHDTFAVVPLLNGFGGLLLVFKITWLYIKKIKYSYLAFAAIPWILFTLYYNVIYSIIGCFLLYAAEFQFESEKLLTKHQ